MQRIVKALLVVLLSGGVASFLASDARAQDDVIVGNPPGGGLPDGEIIPGGTQTNTVVPVHFQVFPVKIQLRVATEQLRRNATAVSINELRGICLANLALGRAPGTALNPGETLALAVGDDAPGSHRLIVFNRLTSTQTALIARAQREDIVQDATRKVGLLKFTFVASAGTEHAIRGGNVQLVNRVFSGRKGISMIAGGNGFLDFTREGVARRAVLASVSLQAAAAPVGSFVE